MGSMQRMLESILDEAGCVSSNSRYKDSDSWRHYLRARKYIPDERASLNEMLKEELAPRWRGRERLAEMQAAILDLVTRMLAHSCNAGNNLRCVGRNNRRQWGGTRGES